MKKPPQVPIPHRGINEDIRNGFMQTTYRSGSLTSDADMSGQAGSYITNLGDNLAPLWGIDDLYGGNAAPGVNIVINQDGGPATVDKTTTHDGTLPVVLTAGAPSTVDNVETTPYITSLSLDVNNWFSYINIIQEIAGGSWDFLRVDGVGTEIFFPIYDSNETLTAEILVMRYGCTRLEATSYDPEVPSLTEPGLGSTGTFLDFGRNFPKGTLTNTSATATDGSYGQLSSGDQTYTIVLGQKKLQWVLNGEPVWVGNLPRYYDVTCT